MLTRTSTEDIYLAVLKHPYIERWKGETHRYILGYNMPKKQTVIYYLLGFLLCIMLTLFHSKWLRKQFLL